jgi:hypothetical protein
MVVPSMLNLDRSVQSNLPTMILLISTFPLKLNSNQFLPSNWNPLSVITLISMTIAPVSSEDVSSHDDNNSVTSVPVSVPPQDKPEDLLRTFMKSFADEVDLKARQLIIDWGSNQSSSSIR